MIGLFMLAFIPLFLIINQFPPKQVSGNTFNVISQNDLLNVSYGLHNMQKIDIYLPNVNLNSNKVVLFIHGGGWATGDKSDYSDWAKKIRDLGFITVSMNYRLAPNYTHPKQTEDIRTVINYLTNQADKLSIHSPQFILVGGSAGAHLALLFAYNSSNNYDNKIKGVISLAGPVVLTDKNFIPEMQTLIRDYIGAQTDKNNVLMEVAPINHVSSKSPPTLIIHGTEDVIVPYVHAAILKNKLEANNIPVQLMTLPGVDHFFNEADIEAILIEVYNFCRNI